MIVLGIEASAREGSVALVASDRAGETGDPAAGTYRVLHVERLPMAQGAGRLLAPAIERLLAQARIELPALACIAVGLGPGGYTGARLAVATALGLGFAANVPVLGIESTAALAANPKVPIGDVGVVLDAKNGDVYAARYRKHDRGVTRLVAPFVAPAARALELLGACPFFAGDGLPRLEGIAQDQVPSIAGDASIEARAEEVGGLGLLRHSLGESDPREAIRPLYLRVSEAERLFAARRAAKSS